MLGGLVKELLRQQLFIYLFCVFFERNMAVREIHGWVASCTPPPGSNQKQGQNRNCNFPGALDSAPTIGATIQVMAAGFILQFEQHISQKTQVALAGG